MKTHSYAKQTGCIVVVLFLCMNAVAFFHAYRFTHFSNSSYKGAKSSHQLSWSDKIQALFLGMPNPRPVNRNMPSQAFNIISLPTAPSLECWHINQPDALGTVILFHGYGESKSSLVPRSNIFLKLGYNTFLVDFMGCGGSAGDRTTIGFCEAENVAACFQYLRNIGEKNIVLFGSSLGAVAILRAMAQHAISPESIILECPFGSMYQTTCARFKNMHLPCFPMAPLLVFWGGLQHGFWAFSHNSIHYASSVHCPCLLLHGGQDPLVSSAEIDAIFTNLAGPKFQKTYPNAEHESYLKKYPVEWAQDVQVFLDMAAVKRK